MRSVEGVCKFSDIVVGTASKAERARGFFALLSRCLLCLALCVSYIIAPSL